MAFGSFERDVEANILCSANRSSTVCNGHNRFNCAYFWSVVPSVATVWSVWPCHFTERTFSQFLHPGSSHIKPSGRIAGEWTPIIGPYNPKIVSVWKWKLDRFGHVDCKWMCVLGSLTFRLGHTNDWKTKANQMSIGKFCNSDETCTLSHRHTRKRCDNRVAKNINNDETSCAL